MKKIICTIFLIIITLLSLKSILLNSSIYEPHKEESNASTLSKYDSLEFEYAFEGALSQYDIVDISSSFNFTLILTTTGEVYGFGHNFRGQLGDGTTESSSIPIKVVDNPESGFVNKGVTAISAGGYNSLILKDGVVYSFGWNRYGELGDGTIDLKSKPVKVNPNGIFLNNSVTYISAGDSTSFVIENGKLFGFGRNLGSQLGVGHYDNDEHKAVLVKPSLDGGFQNNGDILAVSSATWHTLVLTTSGVVYSFGSNMSGQLGTGEVGSEVAYQKSIAVKVLDNSNAGFTNIGISYIEVGYHTSLLIKDGILYSWGRNVYGQLGIGSDSNMSLPQKVKSNAIFTNQNVTSASIGYESTLVVAGGVAYSFGRNAYGQLGDGTGDGIDYNDITHDKNEAVVIADSEYFTNSNIKTVISGAYHSLLVTDDNKVYTFGSNSYGLWESGQGQLGTGTDLTYSNTPTQNILKYQLSGFALLHTTEEKTKYKSNVVIDNVKIDATLELKVNAGEYQDITLINGKYIVGDNGDFLVNTNEEKEFTLRATSGNIVSEYTFIVDKKPPTLSEIIESGNTSVCNVINNNEYYCNSSVSFVESTDLSGFYLVKKEVLGVETDITLDIRNGLINELATANTEKSKITYTLIDGAGNQTIVKLILDNYTPRIELK